MFRIPTRQIAKVASACVVAVGLSVGSIGVASAHGRGGGSIVTDDAVVTAITEVALAEVPDGTIIKIKQTRRGNAAYEVYLTDADGKKVKVYLDAEFGVADVVTGGGHKGGHGDDQPVTDETIIAAASAAALEAVPGGTVVGVYTEDDHGAAYEVKMTDADGNRVKVYLDAEYNHLDIVIEEGSGGTRHGHGDDQPVTDETIIAAASAAALEAVPGGTVVGVYTEDDHGAAYEVKMTDADRNKVKVYLDAEYNVLDVKTYTNNGGGRGGGKGHGHRRGR